MGKQLGREKETSSESQRVLKDVGDPVGRSQSRPAVTSQLPGAWAGAVTPSRWVEAQMPGAERGGGPIRTGASEAAGASKT